VVPKEEFKESGVLIAGVFFNKIFGESISSRVLPILISLSNFGNVLAVSFSHSRINQELAKEQLIPFSKTFSKLPNAMALHWLITVFVLVIPPKYGNIYELVVNLYSYPGTWVNIFVTIGLFYLHKNAKREKWGKYNTTTDSEHRWNSYWLLSLIFLSSNIFLALFPFVKPPQSYLDLNSESYPYYVFPVTGCSVLLLGVVYWGFRHKRPSQL
jgi:amino acid transporter